MSAVQGSAFKGVGRGTEGHSLKQQPKRVKTKGVNSDSQHTRRQKQAGPVTTRTSDVSKLSDRRLLQFEREGFLVTPQLIAPDVVLSVQKAVQQHVKGTKLAALKQRYSMETFTSLNA
jgi:hypothetical protein